MQLCVFKLSEGSSGPTWYYKQRSNNFCRCSSFICSTKWLIFIYFRHSLQFIIFLGHFRLWDLRSLCATLSWQRSHAIFIVLIILLASTDVFTSILSLQLGQFIWFLALRSSTQFSHMICPQQRVSTALLATSVQTRQTKFWSTSYEFIYSTMLYLAIKIILLDQCNK